MMTTTINKCGRCGMPTKEVEPPDKDEYAFTESYQTCGRCRKLWVTKAYEFDDEDEWWDFVNTELGLRICDECEAVIDKGLVVGNGEEHYCSEKCAFKHHTPEAIKAMIGDDDAYWTNWD